MTDINSNLCSLFGLPRNTTRAVITLEVGEPPRVTAEVLVTNIQSTTKRYRIVDDEQSIPQWKLDELARDMVKTGKSVNWLAGKIAEEYGIGFKP